ncbi:MAG TPA: 1-acyl-sn-glycerol-3-phosphate acyltransferase [Beijerinckiaceae bacterium]|jgi:1-acyl-sn-glycerol-3-phosphate acyltransferase
MLFLRSLVFNVVFYATLILWQIAVLPFLLLPRQVFMRSAQSWARLIFKLHAWIVGTKVEVRGREKIPPGGILVAAKHQSLWETFALLPLFDEFVFVLKRELTWIPIFGWYCLKTRQIEVNRAAGALALTDMNRRAKEAVAGEGRQLIIFPEGTRRPAGAPPAYKFGVAHLYENLGVPCLPIALNSGLFWGRREFLRRPGTIVVEILDPIPPGLPRDAFFELLQKRLEAASNRLYAEGKAELERLGAA